MTPAHELMLAYMKKANDQVVALRRQRDDLHSNLRNMRISRDGWKAKALTYRQRCKLLDSRVRAARQSRDMWKHRALAAWEDLALVRRGVVEVNVRSGMVGADGGDGVPALHLRADGNVRLDVADPVHAPAVGPEPERLTALG